MSRRGLFHTGTTHGGQRTQTPSSASSANLVADELLPSISSASVVDSDYQQDPMPAITIPVNGVDVLDPQKLYKAFLGYQKRVAELEQPNKVLTAENADLHLRVASLSRRRVGKAGDVKRVQVTELGSQPSNVGSDLVDNVHKLGRHHQLFWCVILDVAQFSREGCPPWSWEDFEVRFSTPENQKAGPTAELYAAVPAEFHNLMALSTKSDSGKHFVKEFRHSMSQSCSTSLSLLRVNAALIFEEYNISASHFDAKYTERDTISELQRLLGQSTDSLTKKVEYARFPPILCKDDDASSPIKRFLNPVLFRIARAVIFGKSAITSKKAAVACSTSMYLRPDKYAETTVGLVAWVAIMTRYVLSKDTSFDQTGVGKETKVQYYIDYDFYKRWLLHAKVKSAAWFNHLIATWNDEIFSNHNKTAGHHSKGKGETFEFPDDTDEIARDMAGLGNIDSLDGDSDANETGFWARAPELESFGEDENSDHNADDIYDSELSEPDEPEIQTHGRRQETLPAEDPAWSHVQVPGLPAPIPPRGEPMLHVPNKVVRHSDVHATVPDQIMPQGITDSGKTQPSQRAGLHAEIPNSEGVSPGPMQKQRGAPAARKKVNQISTPNSVEPTVVLGPTIKARRTTRSSSSSQTLPQQSGQTRGPTASKKHGRKKNN